VALFATCYVNYNEPSLGHDLVRILEHNEVPYRLVEDEACCGMPKLEIGDLESVAALKERNIGPMAALAREGYAIVTAVPSCTLMWKHELPLLFPDEPDVRAVADAMFDPLEYLVQRDKDGLLRKDFNTPLGRVSYHVPATRECRTSARKRGKRWNGFPEPRSRRSSAARATTGATA
jgi:Fe-S oxidoreductase